MTHQGNGYVTANKYIREAATSAAWLGEEELKADRSDLWREMKALCCEAKVAVGKVFSYNLRHLFARTYFKAERDLARLVDILGRTSVDTTRYTLETGLTWRK